MDPTLTAELALLNQVAVGTLQGSPQATLVATLQSHLSLLSSRSLTTMSRVVSVDLLLSNHSLTTQSRVVWEAILISNNNSQATRSRTESLCQLTTMAPQDPNLREPMTTGSLLPPMEAPQDHLPPKAPMKMESSHQPMEAHPPTTMASLRLTTSTHRLTIPTTLTLPSHRPIQLARTHGTSSHPVTLTHLDILTHPNPSLNLQLTHGALATSLNLNHTSQTTTTTSPDQGLLCPLCQ